MYRKNFSSVYCYYYDMGVNSMNIKPRFFSSNQHSARVFLEHEDATDQLTGNIVEYLSKVHEQPIVVLCIGTDRSTGDSLGPLVGSKLLEKKIENFHVFGTLKNPVHAVNLEENINHILKTFQTPFIIAVDACLGRLKNVGSIQIGSGPIKPGAGVHKELPEVGDIHITGIVNVSGFMEFFVLQNTRLHLVMRMADVIAESIRNASIVLEKKDIFRQTKIFKTNSF